MTATTANFCNQDKRLTSAEIERFRDKVQPHADRIRKLEEQLMFLCAKNADKWLWKLSEPRRKKCSTRKSKTNGKQAMIWIMAAKQAKFRWNYEPLGHQIATGRTNQKLVL